MATAAQNLQTRYNAIATELATIQSRAVDYKSDAGGARKGSLESYRLQLMAEMKAIREELEALGAVLDEDGALSTLVFEERSQGI